MKRLAFIATALMVLLAACVRPIWLLYAAGGLAGGLLIRLAAAHKRVMSIAICAILIVVGIVAAPAGVLLAFDESLWLGCLCLVAYIASAALIYVRGRRSRWVRTSAKIGFSILGLLALFVLPLSVPRYSLNASRYLKLTAYTARIDYLAGANLWIIRSELRLAPNESADMRIELLEDRLLPSLSRCGWTALRGDGITLTRERKQPIKSRSLPVSTLNAISLESDFNCEGVVLHPPDAAQVMVFAPKYSIAKTYPDSSRSEAIGEDSVRLSFPFAFALGESPVLRLEVISPLFRNSVGDWILQGSFWTPLAWFWAIACAVFADQIKSGIIIPTMRRSFRLLGLKWFDDKKPDEPQESLIIIP
jgi:hypothetical protein